MDIEKLVEEGARGIATIDCLPDGEDCLLECLSCECKSTARAIIALTLKAAAEKAETRRKQTAEQAVRASQQASKLAKFGGAFGIDAQYKNAEIGAIECDAAANEIGAFAHDLRTLAEQVEKANG